MSLIAAATAGAVLGVRHALESDHLAAVATLVEDDTDQSGVVGASWGIGHSLPIVVLGLLFVAFGVHLPESITRLFEFVVGGILIFLGARMLYSAVGGVDVEAHTHGTGVHTHLRVGESAFGSDHQHVNDDSFLVGVLHGFAGSGILVVALVSSAPTMGSALTFLAAFSVLTIATMAAVSVIWGHTLDTQFSAYLKGAAGLFGIVIGAQLALSQVAAIGLF
ncbi:MULTISPECIES: hypothetical protein [unclassified Haladaptatus]|uniref:hypothetical protein n=1 Tax=unclassified Haladaptatus TaxID=2622732 RepID=UPI0023E7846B|nr:MULTISPECIES: hypothetical protein [unclassified Haladaptatus]